MTLGVTSNAATALAEFIATPLDAALAGADDTAAAEAHAMGLFHEVAEDVPAYARFLAERGVDPDEIRTFADFARVPLIDKANYPSRYPLGDPAYFPVGVKDRYTRR